MTGTPEFGELSYTLTDLLIAQLNADDTNDSPISVANGQMYVSEPEHDTDKLRGYGQYTAGLSVPIGSKVNFKMGGVDYSVLEAMGAVTISGSGTTPNQVNTIDVPAGGAGLGYFSVIGKVAATNGAIAVIGHRKVLLDVVPKITADGEANKFNISEAAGYSFPMSDKLFRVKTFETASDFVTPADGTAFAAFFS